jgi:protease IV
MRTRFPAAGIVLLVILQGCAFVSVPLVPGTRPLIESTVQGRGRHKILLVDIAGVISGESRESLYGLTQQPDHVARLKEVLKKADADPGIKAIVVRINSPGGAVTASDIMYRELMEFKKRRSVPVVAMAADSVYAHPTTVTGSIGVIALKFNLSGLLDKVGVVDETITSAALKDSMSPFRGMSDQERAIMQSILDELHARFTDVVHSGRQLLTLQQIAALADGRVFTAAQAHAAGLVDAIGYLDDAIHEAENRAGLKHGARVVMYDRPNRYKNNIYSHSSINLLNIGNDFSALLPFQFMYLWNP